MFDNVGEEVEKYKQEAGKESGTTILRLDKFYRKFLQQF